MQFLTDFLVRTHADGCPDLGMAYVMEATVGKQLQDLAKKTTRLFSKIHRMRGFLGLQRAEYVEE